MSHPNQLIDKDFSPPYIDDDHTKLMDYVKHIGTLEPQKKAIDLGSAALTASSTHNTSLSPENFHLMDDLKALSAEANNRFLAHIIHLKETHNLEVINTEVANNLNSYIVDISVQSSSEVLPDQKALNQLSEEEAYFKVGIKCVEKISKYILD
ncbi:MAG: hypothetical protein P8H22_09855 [Glaciecola sp.]|nr:hypothetical protein [Glaciecola sp.]